MTKQHLARHCQIVAAQLEHIMASPLASFHVVSGGNAMQDISHHLGAWWQRIGWTSAPDDGAKQLARYPWPRLLVRHRW